jgi:3-deoxy-D-manno-octulosonic-acid transferase
LLLLLVPRHPQRFAEVAELIGKRGLAFCRRSAETLPGRETQVWLGDSMGEMAAYYALADLALMGGTLAAFWRPEPDRGGGLRLPGPAWPARFNFAQASADAIACGAARAVSMPAKRPLRQEICSSIRKRCWPCVLPRKLSVRRTAERRRAPWH